MVATVVDGFRLRLEEAVADVKEQLADDGHALTENTQNALIAFMYYLGQLLLHDPATQLPPDTLDHHLVVDAARHAGNEILGRVGDDQKRLIASWVIDRHDADDRHYAEDLACSFVDDLLFAWFIQTSLEAYRKVYAEDDDMDMEPIEREIENFKTVSKIYEDGLKGNPDGIRALSWVFKNTHYIANKRATLPADVEVPWFLRDDWYKNYGL